MMVIATSMSDIVRYRVGNGGLMEHKIAGGGEAGAGRGRTADRGQVERADPWAFKGYQSS